MTSPPHIIVALSLLEIEKSIIENAESLARRVIDALDRAPSVTVQMAGVRGATPSYYSTVLMRVRDRLGLEETLRRLQFEFDSPAQKHAFLTSVDRLRKMASTDL